jgi:hypothetical protein
MVVRVSARPIKKRSGDDAEGPNSACHTGRGDEPDGTSLPLSTIILRRILNPEVPGSRPGSLLDDEIRLTHAAGAGRKRGADPARLLIRIDVFNATGGKHPRLKGILRQIRLSSG